MPQNSEPFKLIKSLTKSEKRHFKLQAKGFSEQQTAHYESLFNTLDTQKEYSRSKTLIALRKALQELTILKNNTFEKKAFEYLDYEVWVRSKLEKISIAETLKKGRQTPALLQTINN